MRDDIYLIDVVAQATNAERSSIETLRNLQVAIPDGRTVPLGEVATLRYDLEQPLVWRRAACRPSPSRPTSSARSRRRRWWTSSPPRWTQLRRSLPPGYSIEVGGTVEDSAKGMTSITAVCRS